MSISGIESRLHDLDSTNLRLTTSPCINDLDDLSITAAIASGSGASFARLGLQKDHITTPDHPRPLRRSRSWRCRLSLNFTPEVTRTSGLHTRLVRPTCRTSAPQSARHLWLDHQASALQRINPIHPTHPTPPRSTAASTTALPSIHIITARSSIKVCKRRSHTLRSIRMRQLLRRSPA